MAPGTCLLCQLPKDLADSHFLPAAAYKALYATGLPVNEPMVTTSKRVFQSSRQITAHRFCSECEDRFNSGGESWMLDKLATLSVFPLREMVLASSPIIDEADFKVFSCDRVPEFKIEKLVHFAVGLFWKSAACTWPMLDGPVNRIDLGPYLEPIRRFVHGTGPFPQNVCLVVYLDSSTPPLIAMTPPRKFQNELFHLFVFYINGLQCMLCVGKRAPGSYGDMSIASGPGHPIFLMPEVGNRFFEVMKPYTQNSRPSTRIMKTLEEWKKLRGRSL